MDEMTKLKGTDGKVYEFSTADLVKVLGVTNSNKTAKLERDTIMDKEILGIPVVPGLVGGGIAELASALIAKIPALSSLAGGNVMVVDLLAAAALGYFGRKHDWAKYGSMFLVFAAFQSQIQNLVGSITGGLNLGLGNDNPGGFHQADTETPAEIERWLNSH